jgi:alkyl hydroperoxide reductase subunit AhpC
MALRINDTAPDFTAQTTEGEIRFHEWMGDSYAIIFSHPRDFTPVCTTEFGVVAQLVPEFEKRNTKVLGVSVDSLDASLNIAKLYNMFPADTALPTENRTPAHTATVRSVFIIGPDKKVRLTMTYPMSVGRNFAEILRALDAVQATDGVPISTPANWNPGEDVIVALSLNDEQAEERFGKVTKTLPYLRFVAQPQR